MKEIYKQLTKATALVALFLMIGTNAWAKVEWIGTSITNFPTTGAQCNPSTWYKIGNTGISVKGPLIKYNSTNKCIDMGFVQGQNDPRGTFGFLKSPDQDRFVTLVFQTFKEKERVIVTEETTDFILETAHSQGVNNVAGAGVSLTFEMKADLEYEIRVSNTNTPHIKAVTVYSDDEILSLDETEAKSVNEGRISNERAGKLVLKLNRSLIGGIWNTFCVPMNVDADHLPICDAVYTLNTYNSSDNTLTFNKVTDGLRANTPYLIKPTQNVTNIAFAGTIQAPAEAKASSNGLNFIGIYGWENLYTEDHSKFVLRASDNKLVYPTSSGDAARMKGFRAYFEWTGGGSVKDMNFIFDDTATGIITVENDIFQENARIYSVDGRYISNSKENLSRGIYIQNGRKFIVK